MELFGSEIPDLQPLHVTDGWLIWQPHFLAADVASNYLSTLMTELAWEQRSIKLYGKEVPFPRLTAWYGDVEATYAYSGNVFSPRAWTPSLRDLQQQLQVGFPFTYNSVLANWYRNGNDSMGWHADNESELGQNPVIASLSLGATRSFHLKHRTTNERIKLDLSHGSLLIMGGAMQHHWVHQIPKTKKPLADRINLTFRQIQTNRSEP